MPNPVKNLPLLQTLKGPAAMLDAKIIDQATTEANNTLVADVTDQVTAQTEAVIGEPTIRKSLQVKRKTFILRQ